MLSTNSLKNVLRRFKRSKLTRKRMTEIKRQASVNHDTNNHHNHAEPDFCLFNSLTKTDENGKIIKG